MADKKRRPQGRDDAGRNAGSPSPARGRAASDRASGASAWPKRSAPQSAVPQREVSGGARRDRRADAPQTLYIEGRRAVAEAIAARFPVRRALVVAGQRDAGTAEFVQALKAAGTPIDRVSREELDAISSHGAHQGIALEVGRFPYRDITEVIAASGTGPALVVVLDHVTDEGNLGAIARSAEVAGASGLVIANRRAAGVGVGTFKTSAGAVLHLPIAQVPNLVRAIDQLKEAGFWVVGASEHAEETCWDAPLDGRVALVMGSEGEGLSRLVRERCDLLVKLPQRGVTESLNVAQAATVLCYEWMRRTWGEA